MKKKTQEFTGEHGICAELSVKPKKLFGSGGENLRAEIKVFVSGCDKMKVKSALNAHG